MNGFYRMLICLILVFLIIGCGVLRNSSTIQEVKAPQEFLNSETPGVFDESPWWNDFNDSTLNRLLDEAFSSNLALEQFAARLEQRRANFRMTRSRIFPALSLSGTWSETDQVGDSPSSQSQPGAFSADRSTISINATAAYELDVWGKLSSGRKAAFSEMLASEEDIQAFVIALTAQVARTYYTIADLQLQVKLVDDIIRSYVDFLDLVLERYERGVAPSIDVYRAEFNLAGARGRKAQIQTALAASEHALSVMLGDYPHAEVIRDTDKLPSELPEISAGVPSELVQRRPDIRSAFHRLRASDSRWAEAVADRFPSFSLTGQFGGSSDQLQDALDPDNMIWSAIGNIILPVFEGGRRKANASRAEAAFRETAARYKETVLNAFREVEDALVRGSQQELYVIEVEKQVVSAENTLRTATDRYLRGVSDYLNVVTAQTSYYNASSNLITAQRELLDARIVLVTALGGGWTGDVVNKISNERTDRTEIK